MAERKYTVELTAREADALMHAAGNILHTEDQKTLLEFYCGSRRNLNAAWRAAQALQPLCHIHALKERNR